MALVLFSCGTQKQLRTISENFNYFQGNLDNLSGVQLQPLIIQPNDILSVSVTSTTLNQEQVAIFALTNAGGMGGQQGGNLGQMMGPAIFGYLVDQDGHINFPLLGKIKAGGLTREQLADFIKDQLASRELVQQPNVLVRFTNLRVNVMGEVKQPGIHTFTSDRITILEALAAAGDLTERAVRDQVIILRQEQNTVKPIRISLVDPSFINGPGYQLRQNDIIYIPANDLKLREATFNPRFSRDLQITTSIASLVAIVFNLIFVLSR